MRKRPFVLMEIMVGMSIIMIILTFIFRFYSNTTILETQITQLKNEVYKQQFFHSKLHSILSSAINISTLPKYIDTSSFYLENNNDISSLVLYFDNGVDPDPCYSGPIQAEIFLENSCIMLKLTSIEKIKKNKIITLMQNVKSLTFDFLETSSLDSTKINWSNKWEKQKQKIPSMVKLNIEFFNSQNVLSYVFFIPSSYDVITYRDF